ncbi:complex I NDUFA9 subunit family protein [Rhizobiales bacterium]|uniref:complex I NDUFA9 subunit family protein n=1 Tax=Hongsoonwoonella zoysiae TaxID=2821844 RepID=UPI001560B9CD|nr:complex I NDUFA9 subunit family protein [Hongsoonwoonella zoysiae]NRG16437.1 complex I NDUFA9 subunit family protein [Hongsoonwoonella zoysiae]
MATALNGKLVTVFGGSGFIGRYVVRSLARRGYRVRVAVRRPDLAEHVQPLGVPGQIMPVQANLRYRWSVDRAVEGADAVVNCVGILHQAGAQTFDAVQSFGPRAIAEAARAAGIKRVVHISAIGADPEAESGYARSKAAGEKGMFETVPEAIVFRPSVVFGPEDEFFNRFADMARISPVLPLIGGGETKFQPVYVADVAEAVARAVDGDAKEGTVYELGGPDIKSFRECMEGLLAVVRRKRLLVSIPFGVASIQARILQVLPKPPLTIDQVKQLKVDNVVSEGAIKEGRTLKGLGVEAHTLAAILPTYLGRFRLHGQYDEHRTV